MERINTINTSDLSYQQAVARISDEKLLDLAKKRVYMPDDFEEDQEGLDLFLVINGRRIVQSADAGVIREVLRLNERFYWRERKGLAYFPGLKRLGTLVENWWKDREVKQYALGVINFGLVGGVEGLLEVSGGIAAKILITQAERDRARIKKEVI